MNILIITPTHPLDIAEVSMELMRKYNQDVSLFSVQTYALLAEETFEKPYANLNYLYTENFRKKPAHCIQRRDKQRHVIVYGNLDKRTDIHWDHIIAFTPRIAENEPTNFDPYLDQLQTLYKEANLPPIKYYSIDDTDYTFPTWKHLHLFLKTLGIKENDGIQ